MAEIIFNHGPRAPQIRRTRGRPRVDISGKKFGRLTAIHCAGVNENSNAIWEFDCDCGTKGFRTVVSNVRRGATTSCGCLRSEKSSARIAAGIVTRPVIGSRSCVCCSGTFLGTPKSRFCSSKCRWASSKRPIADKTCAYCGLPFTPSKNDKTIRFCGSECRRSAFWAARNAKRRKVATDIVNPYVVFARAGWRCESCGVKTPRGLRGTFGPNAPELDHIMPLSLGGAHSYSNTRCLCRRCNGKKSNRPEGQTYLSLEHCGG